MVTNLVLRGYQKINLSCGIGILPVLVIEQARCPHYKKLDIFEYWAGKMPALQKIGYF
jgi:hypothetical protein